MGQLRGGTTIGGYTALHSGLKEAYLSGNLTINGQLTPTTGKLTVIGDISFDGTWNGSSQDRGLYWTGFDKESAGDDSDSAHIIHTNNSGGLAGSVLEIKSMNDASDGINLVVNSVTSGVRINGNAVWNNANLPNPLQTSDAYMALDTSGNSQFPRMVPKNAGSSPGWVRVNDTSTGILPYSNGNSSIGTSSWKFRDMHAVNFYENGTALSSKYATAGHNHDSSYASAGHSHNYQQHILTNGVNSISASTDWNNYAETGFYMGSGMTNQPTTGSGMHTWKYMAIQQHNSTYTLQTSVDFNNKEMHFRTKMNSTWQGWNRVWHDGNFTPSSYVATSGDTMSGKLWANGGLSVIGAVDIQGNVTSNNIMSADHIVGTTAIGFGTVGGGLGPGTSNYDHIRFDDGDNAFHFVADASLGTAGNAKLYTGRITASSDSYHVNFTGGGNNYHMEGVSDGFNIVESGVKKLLELKTSGDIVAGDNLYVSKHYRSTVVSITSSGWYNIASNPGDRASARFKIMTTEGGGHQMTEILASAAYNRKNESDITVLSRGGYSTGEKIGAVRLLTAGTYDTMYLQVYIYASSTVQFYMHDNDWDSGWTPMHFTSAGIPAGYSDMKLEFYPGVKRANVFTSSSSPHAYGLYPGDVWIQY